MVECMTHWLVQWAYCDGSDDVMVRLMDFMMINS